MPTYTYTAIDGAGNQQTGRLSAPSRSEALERVSAKGLYPMDVDSVEEGGEEAGGFGGFSMAKLGGGRVSATAVENFTRELANLLEAGVSLSRSLSLMSREASNPAAGKVWSTIHDDVSEGLSLAEAMGRHRGVFSEVQVAMVRAGEAGGFLDTVLNQIADFQSRERDLKGRVKAAMVYPAVLATVAVGVLAFLMTYFIPKFEVIFRDFGADLPALTEGVIAVSEIVRGYGFFVMIGVVAAVVGAKRAMQTPKGRRRLERVLLGTPALGTVVARFALVRFTRMLGTLIASGVPLVASLKVAKEALGNQTLADAVDRAIDDVRSGESLARSLGLCPQLFPATVIEMTAVAEETGRLDKELVRLAGSYEGELDRRLRMLVSLAEPLLLFVMAALIGTIVVAMLMPLFLLQDLIK